MLSASRIVISAAGGGKTTRVVDQALAHDQGATALITYTRNNVREIQLKAYERSPVIPSHVEVISWYSFLLRELARPYRSKMHPHRIDGIHWVEGKSVPYIPASKTGAHYFLDGSRIYSDKIAKFVCECDRRSGGAIMRRLKQRFSHIIIDEIQDMAGYDLDLLELILKSGTPVTFVGDHRQATFATNNAAKNKAFVGPAIIKKFEQWKTAGLTSIEYECHTHRCNQAIADLGDSFFPNEPKTVSKNNTVTGHDGIFLVASTDVAEYVGRYSPQVLRYSAKTKCDLYEAMNFGESKGLTFARTLVYPHGLAGKWLATGKISHVEKSATKMYVAATRARYSVAFVFDGTTCGIPATRWQR
ncbi:MAG: UvrD-helicase domain-containing protein [Brevundimonas sp.]|uniref:UvrD-helicase domain-containing protein n=1 Tax=Brevundimonas sp. TaxID=1871086 RepID=UPI0024895ADD|nr:UvrD-helicase domain-containing protein [Brevundimonas sp.]MDI1326074.1 UvrD-helicase domain-containing protein [Brevundimonas sp.]